MHPEIPRLTDTILVAVAWPYANGEPHLGHVAGSFLPADIFARYHRQAGNRVLMVSGSDMHGTPTALIAQAEGVSPEVVATRYHEQFVEMIDRFGFSYDLYTHTDTANHARVSQGIFSGLLKNGYLYESTASMPYCLEEQRFLSDRFVTGTCPICDFDKAGGDQCDNCGNTLDASDLIEIRCVTDGSTPEFRDTNHYLFKLSAFTEKLIEWVSAQHHFRPQVRNMSLAMLRGGLPDRAITRDIEWGIPVPDEIEGYEHKRIYVWFEAVIGYLSASIEWAEASGDPDAWEAWWKDPAARSYYFQGKDNIPFHAIFWPATIMGLGEERGLNLPYDVAANEYLNYEGGAFSKSRQWGVTAADALDRYDADALRYYMSATMPETSDSDFTWATLLSRNNDELVATLGNFVHRVLSMVARNFDGAVPPRAATDETDADVLAACETAMEEVGRQIRDRKFREGLRLIMGLARDGNKYVDTKAPWKTAKTDMERTGTTLSIGIEIAATLRTLIYAYMPGSAQKLHSLLGAEGEVIDLGWTRPTPGAGRQLPAPVPLFKKLDDSMVAEELARHESPTPARA